MSELTITKLISALWVAPFSIVLGEYKLSELAP